MSKEKKFNDVLNIDEDFFTAENLLNPAIDKDERYYIDIFKFKDIEISEFKNSYSDFLSYFTRFFTLMKSSTSSELYSLSFDELKNKKEKELKNILKKSDPAFRGAFNMLNFKERDGFNIGYADSLNGSSIGIKQKFDMLKAAKDLLNLKIDDPEVFCLLPFLQEGIGCDRISDMFISINYKHFLKYTEGVLKRIQHLKKTSKEIENEVFTVFIPKVFKDPLILIPKNLLQPLPTSISWDDIFYTYDENSIIRHRLNAIILQKYGNKKHMTKEKVVKALKENPSIIKSIIKEFRETTSFTKFEKEIEQYITNDENYPDFVSLEQKVKFILNKFKWYVEDRGIWKSFYYNTEFEGDKFKQPLSEAHIQRAFLLISEPIAEQFQIDISPEVDLGCGIVDFKFSNGQDKILVELKLSTHNKLVHGYVTQLTDYITAAKPIHSYFLIVELLQHDKKEQVKDNNRTIKVKKEDQKIEYSNREVFVVDGKIKLSSSKK